MVFRFSGTVFSAGDAGRLAAVCRKAKQLCAQAVHLIAMLQGEFLEDGPPPRRERYHHNPRIRSIALAPDQPASHRPADQPHHRMVSLLQKLCQVRHSGCTASGEAGNAKHQLMLLRCNTCLSRRAFAKPHKLAKPIPETCQFDNSSLEPICNRSCNRVLFSHAFNISRRDISCKLTPSLVLWRNRTWAFKSEPGRTQDSITPSAC